MISHRKTGNTHKMAANQKRDALATRLGLVQRWAWAGGTVGAARAVQTHWGQAEDRPGSPARVPRDR